MLIALSLLACRDGVDVTSTSAQSENTEDCAMGSEPEGSDLRALACNLGLSIQEVAPGLRDELRDLLISYTNALQSGDAVEVENLLSAELQSRIDERGQSADFTSKLNEFVRRERRKLSRSIGVPGGSRESMTVTSAQMLADGSIAAIWVAVEGRALPKPFYFVYEDGGYKLNVSQPDTGFVIQSSYLVANGDYETRSFYCSRSSWFDIAPWPATMSVSCHDSCSGFWDGTRFTTHVGSADCDWNAWGTDMTIVNGNPVCNDRC